MTDYRELCSQLEGFAAEEGGYVPLLSNASALLFLTMEKINWAGFYLLHDRQLVVGPFQGKPACVHIPEGKGVCGTSLAEDRVLNVPDVHRFPGHIACDSASNSEIVIPLHRDGNPVAVMDIDSPVTGRFSAEDEAGLLKFVKTIEERIEWKD